MNKNPTLRQVYTYKRKKVLLLYNSIDDGYNHHSIKAIGINNDIDIKYVFRSSLNMEYMYEHINKALGFKKKNIKNPFGFINYSDE